MIRMPAIAGFQAIALRNACIAAIFRAIMEAEDSRDFSDASLSGKEHTVMAKIRCNRVSSGLRQSEALASFVDFHGRTHSIRVERDFLSENDGNTYLPVGIVHVDPKNKAVLIELPHEAETGANRLWMKEEQFDAPIEAFA